MKKSSYVLNSFSVLLKMTEKSRFVKKKWKWDFLNILLVNPKF